MEVCRSAGVMEGLERLDQRCAQQGIQGTDSTAVAPWCVPLASAHGSAPRQRLSCAVPSWVLPQHTHKRCSLATPTLTCTAARLPDAREMSTSKGGWEAVALPGFDWYWRSLGALTGENWRLRPYTAPLQPIRNRHWQSPGRYHELSFPTALKTCNRIRTRVSAHGRSVAGGGAQDSAERRPGAGGCGSQATHGTQAHRAAAPARPRGSGALGALGFSSFSLSSRPSRVLCVLWRTATKKLRIVPEGISGGRSLTGPLRDARRFPSPRWYLVPGATRTNVGFGICPLFKGHSLSRRAQP
jgi:hypothetical protein